MDYWNTEETGEEFPHNLQRKPFGLDNEQLVELLWQNGELLLHTQNNRKQRLLITHDQDQSLVTPTEDPNNLIEDVDTASWIDCPIDESFDKDFCSNFLSEIPPFDPIEKIGASHVNNIGSSSQRKDSSLPPPRFQASHQMPRGECSIRTIGSSHCASNQVDMSCGIRGDKTYRRKMKEGVEREAVEQARTSCSGGSGSSFWKTNCQSNDSSGHKRKSRDPEEYGSPSDATELESAPGSKASQKSGSARRSRVAEVHNLSERRRRDRINEKMKALQELIPHSNKSDKASMLDEAIEYMKSLQLQIQGNDSDDATGDAALHVARWNGDRPTNASDNPKPNASIKISTRRSSYNHSSNNESNSSRSSTLPESDAKLEFSTTICQLHGIPKYFTANKYVQLRFPSTGKE
ncbi:hypothetical protein ACS0TY_030832 [Phlomoides rotata]